MNGKATLVVATLTAAVLLLFNDRDSWARGELLERMGCSEERLDSCLLSLTAPRHPVLASRAGGAMFCVNAAFSPPAGSTVRISTVYRADARHRHMAMALHTVTRRDVLVDTAIMRVLKRCHVQSREHSQPTPLMRRFFGFLVRLSAAPETPATGNSISHTELHAQVRQALQDRFYLTADHFRARLRWFEADRETDDVQKK